MSDNETATDVENDRLRAWVTAIQSASNHYWAYADAGDLSSNDAYRAFERLERMTKDALDGEKPPNA